jgi:hypothetical protein
MKFMDSENSAKTIAVIPVDGDTVTPTGTSGTATITVNGVGYLMTFDTDLDETPEDFKASHQAALGLRGIKVAVAGSVKQKDTITVTGTSGTANVAVAGGLTKLATFASSLTVTCTNFAAAHVAAYLAVGIVLTSSGETIVMESVDAGQEFAHPTITNVSGDLAGSVANTVAPASILVFSKRRSLIPTERVIVTCANTTGDLNGTVAATFVPNFAIARTFQIACSEPTLIGAAINMRDGQRIRLEVTTDGNHAITWNAQYQFAGGTEPTQTSTALCIYEGRYNATSAKFGMTLSSLDVKA